MSTETMKAGASRYAVKQNGQYDLSIEEDAELLFEYKGDQALDVTWKIKVAKGVNATLFFLNTRSGDTDIKIDAEVYGDAEVRIAHLELGEGKGKLNARVKLKEPGANSTLHTAALCHAPLDYDIETEHEAADTKGVMKNYGLVNGDASWKVVCAGRIDKYAVRSESRQETRIMTTGKPEQVKVLPILYIDENDVQASHATSLGQPDEEELYYMESRGLDRREAIGLMTMGYIMPVSKVLRDQSLENLVSATITEKVTSWQKI